VSTQTVDLANLERSELEAALESRGHKRFHARQIFRWIYKRGVTDLSAMTDLSRELRATLAEQFTITTPQVATRERSTDGRKFCCDSRRRQLESVFIPDTPAMTFRIRRRSAAGWRAPSVSRGKWDCSQPDAGETPARSRAAAALDCWTEVQYRADGHGRATQ
jgi:23S rRNA (adenine2503-C2)-methyltransferase